jgi:hypothetical protein
MVPVCPAAALAAGAVVAVSAGAAAGAGAAAWLVADEAAVGTGVDDVAVVPLDVQPAINITTVSNARRLTVTKRYELRFAFMVFDYSHQPELIYTFST